MPKILLVVLTVATLAAQDKIVLSVTRGTQTQTAEISGAVIVDALKALDANVSAGSGANAVDALRKAIVGQLLAILHGVPGTSIHQTSQAYQSAVSAFTVGAEAKPVQ